MKTRTMMLIAVLGFVISQGATANDEFKLPPGPCELPTGDPFVTVQKCKELVDAGNIDAMYQYGFLLYLFAPEPIRGSAEYEKWKPLGNKYSITQWVNLAAEKGNQLAIKDKCAVGNDKLAPANMRAEASKWCALVK